MSKPWLDRGAVRLLLALGATLLGGAILVGVDRRPKVARARLAGDYLGRIEIQANGEGFDEGIEVFVGGERCPVGFAQSQLVTCQMPGSRALLGAPVRLRNRFSFASTAVPLEPHPDLGPPEGEAAPPPPAGGR